MSKKNSKHHKPHILWIIFVSLVWLGCIWYIYQTYVHAESQEHVHYASASNVNKTYNKDNIQIVSNIFIQKMATNIADSINKSKESYEKNYDMESDYSLQKYLSKDISFQQVDYEPKDLEVINSEYIISRVIEPKLKRTARKAFEELAEAFYNQFETRLILVSAYRSYEEQQKLIDEWCNPKLCAKPWTSEHQAGLAVDIHVEYGNELRLSLKHDTVYYRWLLNNAHTYGFHNTYQKWMHVDGQMAEWRHRRYLWKPFAKYLNENSMTIWEYYKKQKIVWNNTQNS